MKNQKGYTIVELMFVIIWMFVVVIWYNMV